MKNDYLEKIVNRMYGGQEVSRAQRDLAWAYKKPAYRVHGRICLDNPIHRIEDAVAIAQQLSLAGINELFVICQFSNQLDYWAAMDAFGLKLRGIEYIDNAEYREEMDCWGSSDQPEKVAALRFSFKEERK